MTEEQRIEKDRLFAEKRVKDYEKTITAELTNKNHSNPFVYVYPLQLMYKCIPIYVAVKNFARKHKLKFTESTYSPHTYSFEITNKSKNMRGTTIRFDLGPDPIILRNTNKKSIDIFKESTDIFKNKKNYKNYWDREYTHIKTINMKTTRNKLSGFHFYVRGWLDASDRCYSLFDAYIKLDMKDDNVNTKKIEKLLSNNDFLKIVNFKLPKCIEKQF